MASHESAAEIGALLDRYLLSLDEGGLDDAWARDLFTADVRIEFPISAHDGIEGVAEYHRASLAAFARTQHLNSPALVTVTGDRARLRANLVSTHVHLAADGGDGAGRPPLFSTGTSVTGEAVRTPGGWRLSLLAFRLIWADGVPPAGR